MCNGIEREKYLHLLVQEIRTAIRLRRRRIMARRRVAPRPWNVSARQDVPHVAREGGA